MDIKKLNSLLEVNLNDPMPDDHYGEDIKFKDVVLSRLGHIEDSLLNLIANYPDIKDSYEYEDITNQVNMLYKDLDLKV